MKQIYDFEQHRAPVLNENMLRNELEKRKVQKQTTLLVIAAILVQICVLLFGFITIESFPFITVMCIGYVLVSVMGSTVIAYIYTRKGGLIYE